MLPIDYYYVNLLITDWSEPDFAGVSFNDLFDRLYALRFRFSAGRGRLCAGREDRCLSDSLPLTLNASSSLFLDFRLKSSARWPVTTSRRTATHGGRSGRTNMELYDYPAVEPYITDVRENPDGTMTLLLSCLSTDVPTDCIFSHELTVRALPSGGSSMFQSRHFPDRARPPERRAASFP